MGILHKEWPIQPQFLSERFNLFAWGIGAKHRKGRVSRNKMNERKSNEGNEENNDNGMY
jgi:hypothetical protein